MTKTLPEDLTELTGEFISPDSLAILLKKNGYRKTNSEWFEHIVDAMYGYLVVLKCKKASKEWKMVINSLPGGPMVEHVEVREVRRKRKHN